MKSYFLFLGLVCTIASLEVQAKEEVYTSKEIMDTTRITREYILESSMLGYFRKDGTRNPVLLANKGDRVKITIINGELMPHDIALEKANIKSKEVLDKGSTASITFTATQNDTYYCSVPGHRVGGMEGKIVIVDEPIKELEIATGTVPLKDGRRLNLNFETGDLTDWKAEGDAFTNAVINSDPSPLHDPAVTIGKGGNYFLSTGGQKDYRLTGTLTSVPFTVTHPYAAFKISGGAIHDTRVEIIESATQNILFSTTGSGRLVLQPVVIDLREYLNKEIFIRIIDLETGISPIPYVGHDLTAHINFDDFLFYSERPSFENELRPKDIIVLPPLDPVKHAGLSGIEAAKAMEVPPGFKVTLAAAEPDIVRPIAFTLDARGRMWVVEGHTYPIRQEGDKGRDRILIFEDTNGDGTFDKKKIFLENLNLVSGIELGMGGVWLGAAPYLLFIPTDFINDKPLSVPQVILDGWGLQDTHEVLNSLRWGPDGWLYGVQGIFTHSLVGKPGSPESERTPLNACVWRFHPNSEKFEVFSEGTSNPWGFDFNDYGHAFSTVCVIPHLHHMIKGARYERQAGHHFNPYTYEDIKTIADHLHYVGDRGPHAANFRSASAGGGHAHAGAMIYLGDTWPEEFRNDIFMNNINGSRFNRDHLERKGSGYVGKHRPDFLIMNDAWSQWLNFRYDGNGSVYVIDWYDKNQCHSPNPDVHDKTLGRIFKISHENDRWAPVNLYKASNIELIRYQQHNNDWFVRQARQLLQERTLNKKERKMLWNQFTSATAIPKKLRALWALFVTQSLTEKDLISILQHPDEYIRSWGIQLAMDSYKDANSIHQQISTMAKVEKSALVRLYILSALQEMPLPQRWDPIISLTQVEEDKTDHNLPLMQWYGFEPLIDQEPVRALTVAKEAKSSILLLFTARKMKQLNTPQMRSILQDLKREVQGDHSAQTHALQELLKDI